MWRLRASAKEGGIEKVEISAFKIPTETPKESDGTAEWVNSP